MNFYKLAFTCLPTRTYPLHTRHPPSNWLRTQIKKWKLSCYTISNPPPPFTPSSEHFCFTPFSKKKKKYQICKQIDWINRKYSNIFNCERGNSVDWKENNKSNVFYLRSLFDFLLLTEIYLKFTLFFLFFCHNVH